MTRPLGVLLLLVVACGGGADESEEPTGPPTTGGEGSGYSEERVDDGRMFFALPDDGSLGDLEAVILRRRDEGKPPLQIIIHTARSAAANDAESYLDSIRRLVRPLHLETEVLLGAPADSAHLTIVTEHPAPVGP